MPPAFGGVYHTMIPSNYHHYEQGSRFEKSSRFSTSGPDSQQSMSKRRPQVTLPFSRHETDTGEIKAPCFGDIPGPECKSRFRIGCIRFNPESSCTDSNGQKTYEEIFTMVDKLHLDVTMIQEVGVNWSKVSPNSQWNEKAGAYLTRSHIKSYMSHNTEDPTGGISQRGGTGIMSYSRSAGVGSDRAKLGRWTWARYQGKQDIMLRCVSINLPCDSDEALSHGMMEGHTI
jgi:hypothetical protein